MDALPLLPPSAAGRAAKLVTGTISACVRPVAWSAVTAGAPGAGTSGARKPSQAAPLSGLVDMPSMEKPLIVSASGALVAPPSELATRPR